MGKKIFFLGSYCSPKYIEELIQSGSSPDIAGINLQGAIINGLEKQDLELKILSIPSRQSYPTSKDIIIDSRIEVNAKEKVNIIGFINLPIIKMVSKYIRFRRELKKQLEKDRNSNILIYSLHSPILLAVCTLKRLYFKSYIVITDLPQYMSTNNNLFYRIGKYIDKKLINYCLKQINGFILLSDQMKSKLPINQKPTIIIEGIYRGEIDINEVTTMNPESKIIMYTGAISKRYNIWELINAFKQINDPTLQLWLCGATENQDELLSCIDTDSRIRYWGLLPSLEVKEMQKKVGLLINPRFGKEEFTRYSFPSKTMEYLASGTPTMMCKLPSLPKEYEDYLFFIEEESENGIKNAIEKFFRIPSEDRKQKAREAKEFILYNKTEKPQTQKIIRLMQLSKKQ